MSHVEEMREAVRAVNAPAWHQLARYWWVELLLGVFWVVVAIVVLKFNHASVVTTGVADGDYVPGVRR